MRWLLPVLVSLVITAFGQAPRNNVQSVKYKDTSDFGQPVTVETGQEIQPSHQGFLQCVVDHLQAQYRHGNTTQVSQNFSHSSSNVKGDAVIAGHGSSGLLCTGNGDSCNGLTDLQISRDNMPVWEHKMETLKGQYQSLTLLSCNVGSGAGRQLLDQLFQVTGLSVRAPDSTIWCGPDGIVFLFGGGWVQSGPSSARASAQSQPHQVQESRTYRFYLDSSPRPTSVDSSAVTVLQFQHRGYNQREFQTVRIPDSRGFLSLIDFAKPVQTKARPGAIVTGKLRLQLILGNKQLERSFILYNDELIEDSDNQDVFYRTDSSLPGFIEALLR